jgi:valyl-tRNA synthetase
MKHDLPKAYNPREWEDKLYQQWEESGFFNPDNLDGSESYCNVLPPPNANGELHLGHASGYTVMDIFGRFQRMQGKKVLLLPGKDHAGIQTQVVFEKKLKEEKGLSRHDLGREKFYEECYAFCMDRANYMRSQEKKIGIGADWSREKFTLDPEVSRIATETFVKMHKDGIVYRGKRIINWCPRCATALSDIEVIHKRTQGKIYFLKYPIKDSSEYVTVATTRPETMLGDTAVAVHPADKRYQHLIGKNLVLPLLNREIPLIADERIDMTFGSGAVKITPAHDSLDWKIGKDHHLEEIQVINEEAKITQEGGSYENMTTLDAREAVLKDLSALGLIEKEEVISINLSQCERCKTTIEPLISKQWFVNVDAPQHSLKQAAIHAIESREITFYPENFKKNMLQWLTNLEDWCISRQIWWGHRIPVWYCDQCGDDRYTVSLKKPEGCSFCGQTELHQESDTFDTWFSSGQWPYTTLGYPEGKDYQLFFPTKMMVMGRDLLFFWASRMIMMSLYRTEKIPFHNLYFTGLIRDKEGYKMSKSRGNGIDVLEMIQKFGADAVRLSLVMETTPGQDSRIYEEKIESFRNFVNKLWNTARYCFSTAENFSLQNTLDTESVKTSADSWIVAELTNLIQEVRRLLENKQISLAAEKLKEFTWNTFADWYIEIHKIEKNDAVLAFVLDNLLRLWHPFMPFVTEAIFQLASSEEKDLLLISKWPTVESVPFLPDTSERNFSDILSMITQIRNIRSVYHVDPAKKITITTVSDQPEFIQSQQAIVQRLARAETIHVSSESQAPHASAYAMAGRTKVYVHLEGVIDIAKERERLTKEHQETQGYVTRLMSQLNNQAFVGKAPEAVVSRSREELEKAQAKLADIEKRIESLVS